MAPTTRTKKDSSEEKLRVSQAVVKGRATLDSGVEVVHGALEKAKAKKMTYREALLQPLPNAAWMRAVVNAGDPYDEIEDLRYDKSEFDRPFHRLSDPNVVDPEQFPESAFILNKIGSVSTMYSWTIRMKDDFFYAFKEWARRSRPEIFAKLPVSERAVPVTMTRHDWYNFFYSQRHDDHLRTTLAFADDENDGLWARLLEWLEKLRPQDFERMGQGRSLKKPCWVSFRLGAWREFFETCLCLDHEDDEYRMVTIGIAIARARDELSYDAKPPSTEDTEKAKAPESVRLSSGEAIKRDEQMGKMVQKLVEVVKSARAHQEERDVMKAGIWTTYHDHHDVLFGRVC